MAETMIAAEESAPWSPQVILRPVIVSANALAAWREYQTLMLDAQLDAIVARHAVHLMLLVIQMLLTTLRMVQLAVELAQPATLIPLLPALMIKIASTVTA